ncbi:MAG TPA: hypothetical protein VFT08_03315 [Pyrinomonadaceae bacterium]|nr:hypothetical protein [Pyrinomonadaceae bacterium]
MVEFSPKRETVISFARKSLFISLVVLGVVLLVAVLGARAWINNKTAVFTRTTSPQNTYSVSLKGAKGRPLLIPYWVRADVYKMGQPYVADVWLHEAWDPFDLSFEAGFPKIRWPANNVVEFYRPENFENGNDVIIVQNRSGKLIRCLFVRSVSKFLVLDFRPEASLNLKVPKTKGDSQWFLFEGILDDGTNIPRKHGDFDRRGTRERDCTYLLSIVESGSAIELSGCQ